MQVTKTFLPNSLESWIVVVSAVVGWAVSVGIMWNKMLTRVNGLGDRVNEIEIRNAKKDGLMERYEDELREARREQTDIHSRLARVEKAVDSTNEHITEMKLEVMGHLGEIKNLIVEKDSQTRERLAVIETVQKRRGDE